jgi:hypothetical protein
MISDINTLKDKLNELYTARDSMVGAESIYVAAALMTVEHEIKVYTAKLGTAVAVHNIRVLKSRREQLRTMLDNDKITYNSRTTGDCLNELNRVREALELQESKLKECGYEEYMIEQQGYLIADYDS